MSKHETVRPMTSGQLKDLIVTLGSATPDDLTFDEAQYLSSKKALIITGIHSMIQGLLMQVFPAKVAMAPSHPAEGEIFTLTVQNDTRAFKLVRIGYCHSFFKVQEKLRKYGDTPEEKWWSAFKEAYPLLDSSETIVGQICPGHSRILRTGRRFVDPGEYGYEKDWLWFVPAN